jgi:hypothetical protein
MKHNPFNKNVFLVLLATILVGITIGCPDDSPQDDTGPVALKDLANASGGSTAKKPVLVTVNESLTSNGWKTVLSTVAAADKYVSLDLSTCTMSGIEFAPVNGAGANKITALTLPNTARSIKAGAPGNAAFKAFTNLTSISGVSIETVGGYAFYRCENLTTVSLPRAVTIGGNAFYGCKSLTTVSLPLATTIGDEAFYGTSLATANLPAATTIGDSAFYACANLLTTNLSKATIIGTAAFSECTNLRTALLTAVETVRSSAFWGCENLRIISLTSVTTIGASAFYGCTSLTEMNLPTTPPFIGTIFSHTAAGGGAITIKVPGGTVPAYTTAWSVDAAVSARAKSDVYGPNHKAITITDAVQ